MKFIRMIALFGGDVNPINFLILATIPIVIIILLIWAKYWPKSKK